MRVKNRVRWECKDGFIKHGDGEKTHIDTQAREALTGTRGALAMALQSAAQRGAAAEARRGGCALVRVGVGERDSPTLVPWRRLVRAPDVCCEVRRRHTRSAAREDARAHQALPEQSLWGREWRGREGRERGGEARGR